MHTIHNSFKRNLRLVNIIQFLLILMNMYVMHMYFW